MENQKQYSRQSQQNYTSQAAYASNHTEHILNTGMLNELLRKQLTPDTPVDKTALLGTSQEPEGLIACAVSAVDELLNNPIFQREKVHSKLSELFYQQKAIYLQAPINEELRKRQYIAQCGLIMSPDNCITTQLDDIRVRSFIRATDKAITEKLASTQETIHVVYPACGPFAPLLMPLIAYYHENKRYSALQLRITLIDMQLGAVKTLEALIHEMNIGEYIEAIHCMDATQYIPNNTAIDIVILEAMQHGLSREGQLPIALHFANLLDEKGTFIPEKIEVTANLCIAQQELVEQWRDAKSLSEKDINTTINQQRIALGNVLTISAENLRKSEKLMLDANTHLLPCHTLTIPKIDLNTEYTLIFSTNITTWQDETIGEYDSGITHPLPDQSICINFTPRESKSGDLLANSGDAIKFYYRLNGLPGFLPTLVQDNATQTNTNTCVKALNTGVSVNA